MKQTQILLDATEAAFNITATEHEEAAGAFAERVMQEKWECNLMAAQSQDQEGHIRQEKEAVEMAAHEEAARAVTEGLMQEQQGHDAMAAQL